MEWSTSIQFASKIRMSEEDPIRGVIEILSSSQKQIGAAQMHSRDLREAIMQTQDAILNSKTCIDDCERTMKRWWYRAEAIRLPMNSNPRSIAGGSVFCGVKIGCLRPLLVC